MTHLRKYLAAACLPLLLCLAAACSKDDAGGPDNNGTTTVKLVFSARQEAAGDGGDANEGMKTLRVIMIDEDGTVDYNRLATVPDNALTYRVEIEDVPLGIKNFYVVANEASVGLGADDFAAYTEGTRAEGDWKSALKGMVVQNTQGTRYFPRPAEEIAQNGLPISGYKENQLIDGTQSQDIEIKITRAVVKINISVRNETTKQCILTGVSLGAFHPRRTFLFDEEGYDSAPQSVTLPENTAVFSVTYNNEEEGIKRPLEANMTEGERIFTYYLFEPNADYRQFTVSFASETHANLATEKVFLTGRTDIPRNSEATLDIIIKDSGINFAGIRVDSWDYTYSGGDLNID